MSANVFISQLLLLSSCLIAATTLVHAQVGSTVAVEANSVQVVLTSHKLQYFAQEPVIVDLHVVNKSGKAIFFDDYGSPLENQNFAVTDNAGHEVPLTAYGKALLAESRRKFAPAPTNLGYGPSGGADLKTGQEAVYHVWLNRVFDLSVSGVYTISAAKQLPNAAGNSHPVSSLPLKISVISPDLPPYSERVGPDETPLSDNSWGNRPGVIHI